jgi:hypothetical protein
LYGDQASSNGDNKYRYPYFPVVGSNSFSHTAINPRGPFVGLRLFFIMHFIMKQYLPAGTILFSAVSVQGAIDADVAALLDACVATAHNAQYEGLGWYMKMGYVPEASVF